jgi:hypothetical protein
MMSRTLRAIALLIVAVPLWACGGDSAQADIERGADSPMAALRQMNQGLDDGNPDVSVAVILVQPDS